MAAEEENTELTSVRTYVPAYQRDIWDEHAEDLDMSRSEFVRSMVQAGRKGFDPRGSMPETTEGGDTDPSRGDEQPLEAEIIAQLEDGPLDWDELFDALTDDIEAQLEETLQDLQARNEIQHSGPEGGYVLVQ